MNKNYANAVDLQRSAFYHYHCCIGLLVFMILQYDSKLWTVACAFHDYRSSSNLNLSY